MSLKLAAPRFLFLLVSLLVLFLSLARVSLQITAVEDQEGNLRRDPIEISFSRPDGQIEKAEYKLPEVNTLPTHPFYGFKKIRDWLWLKFTANKVDQTRLILLFADKKISESRQLFNNNNPSYALDSAKEAISLLQQSQSSFDQIVISPDNRLQLKELYRQIFLAGLAYHQVLQSKSTTFDIDTSRYQGIINSLDDWNQIQKTNWEENQAE